MPDEFILAKFFHRHTRTDHHGALQNGRGITKGEAVLDLDYLEDSSAETDANFVITGSGGIVEVQGTAEGEPFSQDMLLKLLALANAGVSDLVEMQKKAIA